MAHWAELDADNKVLRVVVGDNNDANGDEGYAWIIENLGGTWVQTSYNGNFRKQYAGTGFTYDSNADVFIEPQPFESWILDKNYDWKAPVPKPDGNYAWDEDSVSWQIVDFSKPDDSIEA